jgi:O-antigen ligase
MAAVGFAPAGVVFSTFSGFVAASLFVFLMNRRVDIDWVFDMIVLLGWGIVFLSVARLAVGLNAFISPEFLAANPQLGGLNRTLNSGGALMLGEATLIVLSRIGYLPPGPKRRRMGAIFFVFAAMVLISNQRTATLATLVGIGAVVAAWPRRRRRVILTAGSCVIIIAGVTVYGAWIAAGGDLTPFLPQAVTELSSEFNSDESTYAWRLQQWQDSVALYWHAGLVHQIIGMPLSLIQSIAFGKDLEHLQSSAHSEYIELLVNSGFVGVSLFVSMLVVAMTKGILVLTHRTSDNTRSNNVSLAVSIIISHAVYSYAYMIPNAQGLLLAIALQIIATAPGFAGRQALSRRNPPGAERLGSATVAAMPGSRRAATSDRWPP